MKTAALERPIGGSAPFTERRLRGVAPLVVDDGCDVRVRGGVPDAVRVALLEWLPLTRFELRRLEEGHAGWASAGALAAVLRPPTIWTTEEALAAAWPRHVDPEHLQRLRAAAARLERQLSVTGWPGASAALTRGCATVAADDDLCASVALALLARYEESAIMARRRREAAPTMT